MFRPNFKIFRPTYNDAYNDEKFVIGKCKRFGDSNCGNACLLRGDMDDRYIDLQYVIRLSK